MYLKQRSNRFYSFSRDWICYTDSQGDNGELFLGLRFSRFKIGITIFLEIPFDANEEYNIPLEHRG